MTDKLDLAEIERIYRHEPLVQRLVAIARAALRVDRLYNPCGLEVDMPVRLGGEELTDALWDMSDPLANVTDSAEEA